MGYKRLTGKNYRDVLTDLHRDLRPNWYLEIGTEKGESALLADCNTICVDPNFQVRGDIVAKKPSLLLFQDTSDEFFRSDFLKALAGKINLSFLDGLHLVEALLRDFINVEKLMAPGGVIVIHDIVPIGYAAAERVWDRRRTGDWTGDVWKIVPILREHRPDLKITVLDCAMTGLAVIERLDPFSGVLSEKYNAIVKEWVNVSLDDYGEAAVFRQLSIESSVGWSVSDEDAPSNDKLAVNFDLPNLENKGQYHLAIKIPAATEAVKENWGEYHFGVSLKAAFEKLGLRVRIDCVDQWYTRRVPGEIELVLRGPKPYSASEGNTCVFWILFSWPNLSKRELSAATHIFVASTQFSKNVASSGFGERTSVLLHCTDTNIFHPGACEPEVSSELLFVGVQHPERRYGGLVRQAVASALPITVYGPNWEGLPDGIIRGHRVKNKDLGRYYRSARVVLNDHLDVMRKHGFLNNRIFDALACGVPVISDMIGHLGAHYESCVFLARNANELKSAFKRIEDFDDVDRRRLLEVSSLVRRDHSFENRAAKIYSIISPFLLSASSGHIGGRL
ncbi:glycosyl transferase family 1 [Loktanella sp. PT4BL]|uniref:glycosyltransferase family protein n=1 Tax=Loktanella sp. PT4BL TaxID=2135611 RepID=UPI000D9FF024|nr:class I SAM-dependent methyltransferase [Loktanella sp. PT4BL]PXW67343.1 glycosyl transferase family 1 [Loktanella sp. PT4BL]